MKRILICMAVALAIVFQGLAASEVLPDDISDLYKTANQLLGSKDKTVLASGALRLVLWKSELPKELMLISITGLRNNPENLMSSYPAYSMNEKDIFITKIYQCSWREERKNIVYECGETMKFPSGVRGTVSDQLINDLKSVIKSTTPTKETPIVRSN
jgi:hypothetical protein